ncbi:MAG: hypothetical protein FGM27_04330 [Candidatus Omnitrophica bacterium]|nr:hypothetical protein [Candidatus Omnitrophota bacterium]
MTRCRRKIRSLPALATAVLLGLSFSGCVRLQAGTWYQGPGDNEPRVHEVELNTQNLLPGQSAPGSVTAEPV